MSADHRKPVVAFIVLAVLAAALVGFQRADARSGQFLASLVGTGDRVEGTLPRADTWTDESAVLDHPLAAGFTFSAEAAAGAPRHLPGQATGPAMRQTVTVRPAPPRGRGAEVQAARGWDRRAAVGLRRTTSGDAGRALGRGTDAAARSLWQARDVAEPVTGGHSAKAHRKTSGAVLRQRAAD